MIIFFELGANDLKHKNIIFVIKNRKKILNSYENRVPFNQTVSIHCKVMQLNKILCLELPKRLLAPKTKY